MAKSTDEALPIELLFNAERLGALPSIVKFSGDAAIGAALAEYLGVDAVENFQAELALRRWRKHGAAVEGRLDADITQQCVVTLAPVRSHVSETVTARFLPESTQRRGVSSEPEIVIDPMADDPPEVFDGRSINLGALLLEHLALGIDPYPRAAGAVVPEKFTPAESEPESRPNPFQILQRLRDKSR